MINFSYVILFILVATLWASFKSICLKCLGLVPTKQVSTNSKQRWINCHIRHLSQRKQRYYNRARVSGSQSDWDSYKIVKKELLGECRKAYSNYINNLVSEDDSPTSKKLWSFIKKQKCDHCGVASLEDCGSIHNEPQKKANILNKFFVSVFTKDDSSLPELNSDPIPSMESIEIHTERVWNLLLNLKAFKATDWPQQYTLLPSKRISVPNSPCSHSTIQSIHQPGCCSLRLENGKHRAYL